MGAGDDDRPRPRQIRLPSASSRRPPAVSAITVSGDPCEVRRAARRLCRSEVGLVCMPRFRGGMRGGADCARARISPDGVRIRQAIACRLFAARTRAALSGGWHRPARAGPCVDDPGTPEPSVKQPCPPRIRKAARHRPVSTLTLTAGRRWPAQGARISPVAGLADPPVRTSREGIPFRLILLPAEPAGAPPPPSSRRTLRQIPGGLPPAWTGTLTIHPVTGVRQ
jgi:hypothetical protein